jgi:hypothetical protein
LPAKPVIDWDDRAAREQLVDSRAEDAYAMLARLPWRRLAAPAAKAAQQLATVTGQDLEEGDDGVLRIAQRVAPDRVISTVDPQARRGHKTNHRGFDGFKAHIAIDPDGEIITATEVSAAGTGDAQIATGLLADIINAEHATGNHDDRPAVYGDSAYGAGELLKYLDAAGVDAKVKVQAPVAPKGHFTKDIHHRPPRNPAGRGPRSTGRPRLGCRLRWVKIVASW